MTPPFEPNIKVFTESLCKSAVSQSERLRREVSKIEDIVGHKASVDSDMIIKEIILWCFVMELNRIRQSLYNNGDDLYVMAPKLLEQKGIATREQFGEYLLWFRALGRFRGWPEDESESLGVHGRFAAALFVRLFESDPYSKLSPEVRENAFKRIETLRSVLKS